MYGLYGINLPDLVNEIRKEKYLNTKKIYKPVCVNRLITNNFEEFELLMPTIEQRDVLLKLYNYRGNK